MLGLLAVADQASSGAEPGSGPPSDAGCSVDGLPELFLDLGIDREQLRRRTTAVILAGDGRFPFVDPAVTLATAVSRAGRRWAGLAPVAAVYVAVATLLVATARPTARGEAAWMATLLPLWGTLVWLVTSRHVLRWLSPPRVERLEVPQLEGKLAEAGVVEVQAVCVDVDSRWARRSPGRGVRRGSTARLILRSDLRGADPDLTRFIFAHEVAHVIRDDSLSGQMAMIGVLTIGITAAAANPLGLPLAVIALVSMVAAFWRRELTCDHWAAEAVGARGAQLFVNYLDILERRADVPAGKRVWRRLRRLITHPPAGMRRRHLILAAGLPPG
jgi:Zn-dependent protease with chaperone function